MSGGKISGIVPIYPNGTNSTLFTSCCHVAILGNQIKCPRCMNLVIGYDIEETWKRDKYRWAKATEHWRR